MKQHTSFKVRRAMYTIDNHPAVKALEQWWLYQEKLTALDMLVMNDIKDLVDETERVAVSFPKQDLREWLSEHPIMQDLLDDYENESSAEHPEIWKSKGRETLLDVAEKKILRKIIRNLVGPTQYDIESERDYYDEAY